MLAGVMLAGVLKLGGTEREPWNFYSLYEKQVSVTNMTVLMVSILY